MTSVTILCSFGFYILVGFLFASSFNSFVLLESVFFVTISKNVENFSTCFSYMHLCDLC